MAASAPPLARANRSHPVLTQPISPSGAIAAMLAGSRSRASIRNRPATASGIVVTDGSQANSEREADGPPRLRDHPAAWARPSAADGVQDRQKPREWLGFAKQSRGE